MLEKVFALTVSTVVALALAEFSARAFRDSAFPYLNIFKTSDRYGVVLEPSASARIRSRMGRVTEIRTNTLGFRGGEWSPALRDEPVEKRVLLLGDSQVLGYGVDEADAPAAALRRALGEGWEVLAGATPSWGPSEYRMALDDLGAILRPSHVVVVLNALSDWGEVERPNSVRSDAADGWLVRRSRRSIGKGGVEFPGRRFLLAHSQLVFMVRELWAFRGLSVSREELVPPPTVAERLVRDLAIIRSERLRSELAGVHLEAMGARCKQLGCEVVVLALPTDLQVDRREWRKYRGRPVDLAPTEAMLDDAISDAQRRGFQALNALPVLRGASPGAFLPDDDHLSPAGHRAIARALAASLQQGLGQASQQGRQPRRS